MLNKSNGNMYSFVTHTWNTVKGKCPHGCRYCYMKRWGDQPEVHFDESELKVDLGKNNFIFVGSSCDMWASDIPKKWIALTLEHCILSDHENRFLFQSKCPENMINWAFPKDTVLGTTIESNIVYPEMGEAPAPVLRAEKLGYLSRHCKTMLTIEPIMDFDLIPMVQFARMCNPEWVNIGANTSHKVKLTEPPPKKIEKLVSALWEFTEVKIKDNLKRLMV